MHSFLIPIKLSDNPKSRLSKVLSLNKRIEFMEFCLTNLINSIYAVIPNPDIHLLIKGINEKVFAVNKHFSDLPLNQAIQSVTNNLFEFGHRITILHADLPILTEESIIRINQTIPKNEAYIYPDEYLSGTNGLTYTHGSIKKFVFGDSSYSNFINLAKIENIEMISVNDPGIAFDLDDEEDFIKVPQNIRNKLLD